MAGKDNEWQEALGAIDLSAIESLKTLKQKQDQLSERLQAMDELKASVPAAVYQRVSGDYQQQLRDLEEQASPLKQAARDQYARLRSLLDRFEADHEAVKLDQQELELRNKLGEFDDKEFQKRIKAIETSVKEKSEARARALELKARFLEAFHAESELDAAPLARPAAAPVAAPVEAVANAQITNKGATLSPADLAAAQSRTHEVPVIVGGEAAPGKTQIMSAVSVPEAPRPEAPRPAAPRPPPAEGATQIFRAARLVPQNPEAGKQTYTLTLKPMSIGADTSNDIRVGGPGVDPKHAQITVSMAGFTLVDLGSKHGTRVNAEKVRERPLGNEDVIQIGAARFVFREG
ncbi:MAG: FHA domain-containing protein [Rudaea sp.]|nr:FHA domain-containing protein [Rudaea sp.]